LAGGWKLMLERCERKTLLGWRLLELPNRVTIGSHAAGRKFGWASTDFQRLGVRARSANMARLTAKIGRPGILGIELG